MNKIEGVLFAIIAVLFIAGVTWLIHNNHSVVEQENQLIAEYETQKPVIKEIKRPDQCDDITARMAWSELHLTKQFAECWWDSFDYKGNVETKTSLLWIVCPTKVRMPDSLKSYKLNRVYKKEDYIYEFECKWIDYSKVMEY